MTSTASPAESSPPDRVAETLKGHVFFITGGSGFLGKVLIEKLLRSCSQIDKIYILIRQKKGKEPKQRLEEIFNLKLFDQLRTQNGPEVLANKVMAVCGDVAAPELGMSAADREMLQREVTIVVHAAATIRFDEPLKKAVMLNTRGTKLVLELAAQMKKLKAFVHISTAYCQLEEKVLYEKCYPPPADPHNIIKLMELLDDDIAEGMTKKILGKLPNTYAFTKALGEGLIQEQMDKMPIILVRPSIVIPIWKEPLPGWTDNINGPTGLLIGAGKGVIRTMYCNQDCHADFLPVDIAVNAIILILWNYLSNDGDNLRVCNITSSNEVTVTWEDIIQTARKVTEKYPLNGCVWYPGGSMKKSRLYHQICVVLFHWIPAYFLDAIIYLSGNKPVLLRVHERISKGFEVFEYYANNVWEFRNDFVDVIRSKMNRTEMINYKIDKAGLDLEDYFKHSILATREFILKEMPDTLPAARRHLRIMWWVDKATKTLFWYLFLWYFMTNAPYVYDMLITLINTVKPNFDQTESAV